MAWDRQRRLREKLAHLMELERIKNFSWDDWRRRVLISKPLPWFEVIGYYFLVLVHVVYASQEVSRIRPVS